MATITTTTTNAFSFSFTLLTLSFLMLSLRSANGDPHIDFEPNTNQRDAIQPQQQPHFHTVQLSTLFPSDSCRHSPSSTSKGLNKEASLRVVNKHGPCAQAQQQQQHKPTAEEILREDESRVRTIQSSFRNGDDVTASDSTTIPAKDGSALGSGNYIVTVGLGTPPQQVLLTFDTGSDVTWTQCQPCLRSCHRQKGKIFDPSSSASYRNVSCSAASCSDLSSATGLEPGCCSSTCVYKIRYGDASFSVGFLGTEKLTLTKTDVVDDFYFGCGQNNQGLYGKTAGMLGLRRNNLSLVSQTAQKYDKHFSYCLPSSSSATGFLTFGSSSSNASTKKSFNYTPISTVPGRANFYTLDITAISVGGRKLPISAAVFTTAGAIIDSGTVITRLPPAAYSALRRSFRRLMRQYSLAPPRALFDTCYDFEGYRSVSVPRIVFFFAGGAEVKIEPVGILYSFSQWQACLAFASNNYASDMAIIGNVQQQKLEVVYDVAGGRVGFAGGGCS